MTTNNTNTKESFSSYISFIISYTILGFIFWVAWQVASKQLEFMPQISLLTGLSLWFLTQLVLTMPLLLKESIKHAYFLIQEREIRKTQEEATKKIADAISKSNNSDSQIKNKNDILQ